MGYNVNFLIFVWKVGLYIFRQFLGGVVIAKSPIIGEGTEVLVTGIALSDQELDQAIVLMHLERTDDLYFFDQSTWLVIKRIIINLKRKLQL